MEPNQCYPIIHKPFHYELHHSISSLKAYVSALLRLSEHNLLAEIEKVRNLQEILRVLELEEEVYDQAERRPV